MNGPRPLPPALVTALVSLLLALQWWLGVSATTAISATTDELAHVAGGYSYWTFGDYRLQPENGNLPQRLAGLPWVLAGARIDTTNAGAWGRSNVWILGHNLFYGQGNNSDYLLLGSRALMALTGTALGWLIFAWSRRLWGDAGGLLSLSLYVFSPNFLAHAPLATSDVSMTLALLAACGAWWRHTRKLTAPSLLLSVAAVCLATATKFSFVLLLPIFGLLAVVRLRSAEPLTVGFGPARTIASWRGKLAWIAGSAALHGLAAGMAVWAVFGFRSGATAEGLPAQAEYFFSWSKVMPTAGFWRVFFTVGREWHLLPDAFLNGFATVLYAAAERGAFLNGEYSTTGWRTFFPYAFLVKTPWPELLAYLAAAVTAVAAVRRLPPIRRRAQVMGALYQAAPLLALFGVYWAFSIASHLNIGHRHILPVYPALFIGAGLLLRAGFPRWLSAGAAVLALWGALESARIRPHYLAYFNGFAGGPENGWRHLVDSSLDWGQDLPGLAVWLRQEQRPGENVYVAYAGSGDFEYEGIRARELAPVYNFDKPRRWYELGPGLYCVGATMLQDTYSSQRGEWTLEKERNYLTLWGAVNAAPPPQSDQERELRSRLLYDLDRLRYARLCFYLRIRQPDAVIGYSIFIHRLTAEEVRIVQNGSLTELAAAMEKAMQARAP